MSLRSALLLTAILAVTAQAQAPERHSLQGQRVEIWNLAGQARIEAGSGSEVVVEIRRGGRADGTFSGDWSDRDGRSTRIRSSGSGLDAHADLAADKIRAGAGSGTIRLDLSQVATSDTIRTGSGGINTDFPVTMEGYRRNALRGRIGDGGEGSLRISTGSGGLRLMKR